MSNDKAHTAELIAALAPFAKAYETVISNEAVVKTFSLEQIGRLCESEVSGVHFQRAARALAKASVRQT